MLSDCQPVTGHGALDLTLVASIVPQPPPFPGHVAHGCCVCAASKAPSQCTKKSTPRTVEGEQHQIPLTDANPSTLDSLAHHQQPPRSRADPAHGNSATDGGTRPLDKVLGARSLACPARPTYFRRSPHPTPPVPVYRAAPLDPKQDHRNRVRPRLFFSGTGIQGGRAEVGRGV
jgi:hypothetical protein